MKGIYKDRYKHKSYSAVDGIMEWNLNMEKWKICTLNYNKNKYNSKCRHNLNIYGFMFLVYETNKYWNYKRGVKSNETEENFACSIFDCWYGSPTIKRL